MPNVVQIPAAGAFDPTDITLTDNTSGAFLVKEGSNEYMRIDTTNGSELTQFKMPFTTGEFKYMQETSAGSYPFIKCNQGMARLFPGGDGGGFNFNRVEVTTAHVHLTGSGSEIRIGNSLPVSGSGARAFPASGHSWTELLTTSSTSKIQRVSDGLKMLEVNFDTDSTFTLDDSAGGIFKVQDDAGTPNEFLKIDSDTSASLIEFNVPANQGAGMTINLPADSGSNTGFQCTVPGGAGHLKFGRQATGIYTGGTAFLASAGNASLNIMGNQFLLVSSSPDIVMNLNASSVDFKVTDAADATILEVKEDSSLAHILDSGSSATFEVKHDAMTTTYNQFFKAQEGVGTIITPGDGNTIQICNASTAANSSERIILTLYQNNFLEQYQLPKWYTGTKQTTSSAASSTLTYDVRLGRSESQGHMRTLISSTYSGTHAFTANFTNTLSAFAGNQNWGVTSQIHRFENTNTSNGATLQFGVVTGGTVKFINNSGITTGITDPVSGTQALAAKGSAVAGTYSLLVYRLTQFNTLQGSASLYDDDRYIIELLYAELI